MTEPDSSSPDRSFKLDLRLVAYGPCPGCQGLVQQTIDGHQVRCRRQSCRDLPLADCVYPNCRQERNGGFLCSGHYQQRRKGRALTELRGKASNAQLTARDESGRKRCAGCERWLDVSLFHKRKIAADGLSSRCRDCLSLAGMVKKHNLPVTAYLDLLAYQGGACAICERLPSDTARLVVDHRHSCCPTKHNSCGKCVRGLLCGTCNAAIGLFREDPEAFRGAITYKQRWARRD